MPHLKDGVSVRLEFCRKGLLLHRGSSPASNGDAQFAGFAARFGGQYLIADPCFASARPMMICWIWVVPSKMRNSRTSRKKRSIA